MAERALLIRGGRIIDPLQAIDQVGDLLITDGKIVRLGQEESASSPADTDIVKATGLIVSPGFIDLHCHLREPGNEDNETIASGTQAAANGGFTTICCMPNTNPALDSKAAVRSVITEAEKNGVVRVLTIGTITKGRAGQTLSPMSELASAGVIGFSDDGDCLMDTSLAYKAFQQAYILGLPIIEHAEHKELGPGGVMNQGNLAVKLGLAGTPAAAEEIMAARDVALSRMTGARLHIAHVSTAGTVDIIRRAKEEGLPVTAEVTPHHLTLTEERVRGFDPNAKVSPPLRTQTDRRALVQGLWEGVIDVIATDHAPHTRKEKAVGFTDAPFGINVFETALGSLMALVHTGQISIIRLISSLASTPVGIIGNKHAVSGSLGVGLLADVTIFDPDREWAVDAAKFSSKSRNTPLDKTVLKGKVMMTISRGEIVYRDKSVKIQVGK